MGSLQVNCQHCAVPKIISIPILYGRSLKIQRGFWVSKVKRVQRKVRVLHGISRGVGFQTKEPFCADLDILFELIICQCPFILVGSRYRCFKSQVAGLRRFMIWHWSQILFYKVFGFKKNCLTVLAASETQLLVNLKINIM